ncbi:hypothetical protein [Metabacillus litoralis]|uniref:hypothetical protein n=1 Tax=Metabacillus litoralis TaxID=152268 RepID=UPI00203F3472|nr:hypothetical protein [Metabacillus litoralis]MCM3413525.1 hypothetical protein [Metabacillus litoralis]
MSVTIKDTNNTPRLKKLLKELGKSKIKVGVFGEDGNVDEAPINLVTLARVHEFGMTIKPKNGKYLTIPANREAKGKRAREFSDLYFLPTDNGNGLLVRNKGKDRIEVMYVLVKSVTIPERSFIRSGYDKNVNDIFVKIKEQFNDVIQYNIDVDTFLDAIGTEFAGMIQKYARDLSNPSNEPITEEAKGSSNPLVDTGRLIGSIRHEVE